MSRSDTKSQKRAQYEKQWIEIAEAYIKNFKSLDEGQPYADFNFIRLSNLYAVACICYYYYAFSPIEDYTFDGLCQFLLEFYEEALAAGVYSGVLEKEMLAAGSGYHWESFRIPLHNIAYFVFAIMRREKGKEN